jgi:hypothetical protein
METLRLRPDDPRLGIAGLHSLEPLDGSEWFQPWRLPSAGLATAASEVLEDRARHASGARFRFVTDASSITMAITGADDSSAMDVVVDGDLLVRLPVVAGEQSLAVELPDGLRSLEVWLPQFGVNLLGPIDVEQASVVAASPPRTLRWATYGSSITQCRTAEGPSDTWPARVARLLDWELTNLGFGGECHLDSVAARTIRDADFEFISLCLGINIYGASSFSERALHSAICGFVETVREGHPGVPMAIMSPIAAPNLESVPNRVGLTLSDVRRIVTHAGETLQHLGEGPLTLIDGRQIFGDADAGLLGDDLHPTPAGYRVMAERLGPVLADAAGRSAANLPSGPAA